MFQRILRSLLPLCAGLALLNVGSVGVSAYRTAESRADAAVVTEHNENLTSVIDGAYDDAVPESGQLRRLAADLGDYLEANDGSLAGFTADPSTYTDLADELGESPFVAGTICDDCGRLNPDFAERVETRDTVLPEPTARSWASVVRTAFFNIGAYLAGSSLFTWWLLRREARRDGHRWRDIRWHRSDPNVAVIGKVAPLSIPVFSWWLSASDVRYREAVEALDYNEELHAAQTALRNLRGDSTDEGRQLVAELEGLIAKIDAEVAAYDPEARHDPDSARREARAAIDATVQRLELRRQAKEIVDGTDWSKATLDESAAEQPEPQPEPRSEPSGPS